MEPSSHVVYERTSTHMHYTLCHKASLYSAIACTLHRYMHAQVTPSPPPSHPLATPHMTNGQVHSCSGISVGTLSVLRCNNTILQRIWLTVA